MGLAAGAGVVKFCGKNPEVVDAVADTVATGDDNTELDRLAVEDTEDDVDDMTVRGQG